MVDKSCIAGGYMLVSLTSKLVITALVACFDMHI
jgi:hypothetical protein